MIETDRGGFPFDVDDLDADTLHALLEDAEAQSRAAERRKLNYAYQWCVLHPAKHPDEAAMWMEAGDRDVLDCDETIGAEGTPLVAAFAAEELAAGLRMSTRAGLQLMADALNLRHRLPRIEARVQALEVPVWRARRIAQATTSLSQKACAIVDAHLVDRAETCGVVAIDRAIAEARAAAEPEALAAAEDRDRAHWRVRLTHGDPAGGLGGWAGTSWLDAAGDTADLTRFHDVVCAVAAELGASGDTDPLDVRKAKALGVIADRATGTDAARTHAKIRLYLHLDAGDLDPTDTPATTLGYAERLGPVTLAKIRQWLGAHSATIQPVLHLAADVAVDRHDPPAWMRDLVILRDQHCVFPWCTRDARSCDLDHIDPYDDAGPPGQTHPDNLAALCRRHHRCKTSGRWRYRRSRDGSYLWTAPTGQTYTVTPSCTYANH
jgi:hypothetical protein